MGTKSHIAIERENGAVESIRCQYDGYPAYNGAVLFHHYQEPEKIRELIAPGDISSLAASVKPAEGEHTFDSPQKGVVVAYGRDRHEDGVSTKHFDTLDEYEKLMCYEGGYIEYVYLYQVCDRKWVWAPAHDSTGLEEFQDLTERSIAA